LKELNDERCLVVNNQGQTVKFTLDRDLHMLGRKRAGVDLLVPDSWTAISPLQAILSRSGNDYYIFNGDGNDVTSNRFYLNRSTIPSTGQLLVNGTTLHIGLNPKTLVRLTYYDSDSLTVNREFQSISLNQLVTIGSDPTCTLQLDSPTVARFHATIEPTKRQGFYRVESSTDDRVRVGNLWPSKSTVAKTGETIQIGCFTLLIGFGELEILDRGDSIRLDIRELILETNGKRRLDDISFAIEPGEFVALVGGSGAGKSTLMQALLGTETPTSGGVYINGANLQQNYDIYRSRIGYVPQDDIIHTNLTFEGVLSYAARLRLPSDINVKSVVDRTLEQIEMTHRRRAVITNLSGGQRKRVSIGVELIADPKLFFLDEPTSGLDPGLDRQMMQLLRSLAHEDRRTIVLVTHAVLNIELCDRIVFLGRDGKLCYFGSPDDILEYFDVDNFADIYVKLEDGGWIDSYAAEYECSDYCREYMSQDIDINDNHERSKTSKVKINALKQWFILTHRQLDITCRDRSNLILALVTAPIGIGLLKAALPDTQPFKGGSIDGAGLAIQVLLIFSCAALWVGLFSSAQEIVKESAIYMRERLVNLQISAYFGSKFIILTGLAIAQSLVVTQVIMLVFKSPITTLISWQLGVSVVVFLTITASFSLGLLVSTVARNSSQVNSALPLILLPQIIFSGVLFKLKGIGALFSYLTITRWSLGAFGTIANVNGLLPATFKHIAVKNLPFPLGIAYERTWNNLYLCWIALGIHSIVYLAMAVYLQRRKNIT
jgi:ABC transport system ATP-binding/permease protein